MLRHREMNWLCWVLRRLGFLRLSRLWSGSENRVITKNECRAHNLLLSKLFRLVDWLISQGQKACIYSDFSSIYTTQSSSYLSSYLAPFAYPFELINAALDWYEPLSWGISISTHCISNGPELWGSRCRYTCNTQPLNRVIYYEFNFWL
jgi:hypothetical protein